MKRVPLPPSSMTINVTSAVSGMKSTLMPSTPRW